MLVICKHCINTCKKFGKVDCDDYNHPTIEDLEKEYRQLMQTDPAKAKEIKKKIDFIWFGIE